MPNQFSKIPVKIFGSGPANLVYDRTDEKEVIKTIHRDVLPSASGEYSQVNVKVRRRSDGKPDYMIAYLLHKDTYTAEVKRIGVDENFQVTDIKEDYDDSLEFNEDDAIDLENEDTAAYSFDMVVATPCDHIPSAVEAVDNIYNMAREMGLNTKKLIGSEATLANYRTYLTAGLKGFVNIGHGNTTGIVLHDGMLSASWFQGQSHTALAPAVVYFNSCKVHNPPLDSSIMGSGARTFIGGNVNLAIGASEEVCKCFWSKAMVSKKPMGPSLVSCEKAHYPTVGAHGISGDQGIFALGRSIGLRAVNDRFVCAEKGGAKPLVSNRNVIRGWETFEFIEMGDNKVAFRAVNGKYVCAEGGGGRELIANRPWIRSWETFTRVNLGGNRMAFKACNGQYICAENAGQGPLMANRNSIRSWETFDLIGLRLIGLRASNNKYVCAIKGGQGKLVANRPWLKSWETFVLTELGGDKVALLGKKGRYVCADLTGDGSLIANRPWIRSWETFQMEDLGHQVSFKACNGKYVRHRGEQPLVADRTNRTSTATFHMVEVGPNFNWLWDQIVQMEKIELAEMPIPLLKEPEKEREETPETEKVT